MTRAMTRVLMGTPRSKRGRSAESIALEGDEQVAHRRNVAVSQRVRIRLVGQLERSKKTGSSRAFQKSPGESAASIPAVSTGTGYSFFLYVVIHLGDEPVFARWRVA